MALSLMIWSLFREFALVRQALKNSLTSRCARRSRCDYSHRRSTAPCNRLRADKRCCTRRLSACFQPNAVASTRSPTIGGERDCRQGDSGMSCDRDARETLTPPGPANSSTLDNAENAGSEATRYQTTSSSVGTLARSTFLAGALSFPVASHHLFSDGFRVYDEDEGRAVILIR